MSEWIPICGYETRYTIARDGRVRSLLSGKLLSTQLWGGGGGYPTVTLCLNGSAKKRLVHRLLAEHFLGGIPPNKEINHKDGNKLNHALENLEVVTRKENRDHAVRTGLLVNHGEHNNKAKLTEAQALEIKYGTGKIRDVGKAYGVTHRVISLIRRGLLWRHIK